jgi:hypothetical protein
MLLPVRRPNYTETSKTSRTGTVRGAFARNPMDRDVSWTIGLREPQRYQQRTTL